MKTFMPPPVGGIRLESPAVELSIDGVVYRDWHSVGNGKYVSGPLRLKVEYSEIPNGLRKHIELSCSVTLPTPDYLIVDRQTVPDGAMRRCGYRASAADFTGRKGEEEGGGIMPGCGYPLIGKRCFVGLEHQAGFNTVLQQTEKNTQYELRQHPIWRNGCLESANAVFGVADDPEEAFRLYLDGIICAPLKEPLFSFCTFWSEPYLGNYEYQVGGDNYLSIVRAFTRLGLHPDIYTLDAGWQDRNSVFAAKSECGGEAGLISLRHVLARHDTRLGLWISHNGPMGIAPEYLRKLGIAVGAGESSTYCGSNFGVLVDEKLEKLLTERFCALASSPLHTVHFKMDWDNDCAVSSEFKSQYPTRDHVREGSINAQNRIAMAIRRVNPAVVIRHGWWPSPWQLTYANHLFLADSGDSEYSSLPSRDQRNSCSTARDIQYYNHFRRDKSMTPLDCIDNHEFPQAPRNPFFCDDAVWCDTAMLAIMRGSSYLPWTLQPEALEDSQAKIIRQVMAFARANAKRIFTRRGDMILGHPGQGEIYGFRQISDANECWCLLRNPRPLPTLLEFDAETLSPFPFAQVRQIYPYCAELPPAGKLLFTAHEVKLLIFSSRAVALPWKQPYQVVRENDRYLCRFPASVQISSKIGPDVAPVYRTNHLIIDKVESMRINNGHRIGFRLRSFYRTRRPELQMCFKGMPDDTDIRLYCSRSTVSVGCCYPLPLKELRRGVPGLPEQRNPESVSSECVRYFTAGFPAGGEIFLRLELSGPRPFKHGELWASGFEAPSRGRSIRHRAPEVPPVPPPVHPLGFPFATMIELKI
jgi:hypothetical protein